MSDVQKTDAQQKQIDIAARLQLLWLEHMERLLTGEAPKATSTDLATLARVLRENGWSLDPSKLPQSLSDMLTTRTDPKSFDEEDGGPQLAVMP